MVKIWEVKSGHCIKTVKSVGDDTELLKLASEDHYIIASTSHHIAFIRFDTGEITSKVKLVTDQDISLQICTFGVSKEMLGVLLPPRTLAVIQIEPKKLLWKAVDPYIKKDKNQYDNFEKIKGIQTSFSA